MNDSEKLQEMVNQLADMVNNMGFDYLKGAETIAETLVKKHRTLQQNTLRLIAQVIKKYSELIETRYKTDLRNEAAAEWAKQIAETNCYFPFI